MPAVAMIYFNNVASTKQVHMQGYRVYSENWVSRYSFKSGKQTNGGHFLSHTVITTSSFATFSPSLLPIVSIKKLREKTCLKKL